MNNDELAKVWLQILAALPATLMAAAALFVQWRRDKNKPVVDQADAKRSMADADKSHAETITTLVDALGRQGKTVSDLLEDLAELPQLKSELKTAQIDLKEAQGKIKKMDADLNFQIRRSDFFISFARTYHTGANHLYRLLLESGLGEKAEWRPADKFPTGPLMEAQG